MAALALAQGFALSFGLIAAVGPQNTHVLTTGMRRQFVGMTVAICVGADVLLIAAGAMGLGRLLGAAPRLTLALQLLAAAFLGWHALRAWQSVRRGDVPSLAAAGDARLRRNTLAATLAVTFANPGVYLETLLLVGSAAAEHPPAARVPFALGAVAASALWFSAIGWGASCAGRWLRRPLAWQIVHAGSALAMAGLAISLLWSACG
jgi:L-lysine exporter family protein LysE/ArgO